MEPPDADGRRTAYARRVQEFDALAPRPLTEPVPSRLPCSAPRCAEILALHAASLDSGALGYLDPESGLFVLNAQFLADRQRCCHTGCRHCPYTAK